MAAAGRGEHNGIPMASASYLRSLTVEDWEPYVPPRAAALYTRAAAAGLLTDGTKFEVAVLALLRAKPEADFAAVRGVSEGLEHRLAAAVREATSLDDLYTRLKTKRYPHARLRRLVLDAALGIPAELPAPPYIQVLGARKTALSRLKQAALPAGTSLADLARSGAEAAKISELHSKAVDFFGTLQGQSPADGACLYDQTRGNIKCIWRNVRRTVRLLHFLTGKIGS